MTTTLPRVPPRATGPQPVRERVDFAFSPNGRRATCLRTADGPADQGTVLENWELATEQPAGRPVPDVEVAAMTTTMPLDDGRILLDRCHATGTPAPHALGLIEPGAGGCPVTVLGETPALLGGYLVASPRGAELGYYVGLEDPKRSTIWRLGASPPSIEAVAEVPGMLSHGVWLDTETRLLAANQVTEGHCSSGVLVDLVDGSWRRIWSMSERSVDRIVLYSPRSNLLVVTTNVSGEERIGWGVLGEGRVHFPDELHRPGHPRRPLALDDDGERILIDEVDGALSRLLTYTPATSRCHGLAAPPGTISAPASWTGDLVRFAFSSPSQPPTLMTMALAPPVRRSVSRERETGGEPWPGAELVQLDGAAGPIEAIVYGGPCWRQCPHLVLALHGGPLAAWRFEFDPLFAQLAAAGVAVVAPNYRGSTGYGIEHLCAGTGDWGGPDLDDVIVLSRDLDAVRGPLRQPVVLGASYGAFLALLAAGTEPRLFSACVALAPFLSGPSLHDGADAAVRDRVAALGGLAHPTGAAPRDVLRICGSLAARLLLVHGTHDLTIPVDQSRTLVRALTQIGRTEGVDFEYAELDSDHRTVTSARCAALRQRILRFCRE